MRAVLQGLEHLLCLGGQLDPVRLFFSGALRAQGRNFLLAVETHKRRGSWQRGTHPHLQHWHCPPARKAFLVVGQHCQNLQTGLRCLSYYLVAGNSTGKPGQSFPKSRGRGSSDITPTNSSHSPR